MRLRWSNRHDGEMSETRLDEFERLCREADQEKDKGNREAAWSLYGRAFDVVGWKSDAFKNLARSELGGQEKRQEKA